MHAPRPFRRTSGAGPAAGHVVTLLTRPGCHLCEDAREVAVRVAAETGASFTEVDITADPVLARRYGEQVPVTLVDGEQHDYWRLDERRLRAALGR